MQEVIVYRNPGEAAFWHMVGDGTMLPLFIGVIVFLCTMSLLMNKVETLPRKYRTAATWAGVFASGVSGVYTTKFVFHLLFG